MSVRRRVFAVLFAAVLAASLLAATTSAASASSTRVVVSLKLPAFHGTLKSSRHGCLGSRRMTLYRKHAGPDTKLGTDRSEDNGSWSIVIGRKHVPAGSYYVTAASRGKCSSAKSKLIPVA